MVDFSAILADPQMPPSYSRLLAKRPIVYAPAIPHGATAARQFRSRRFDVLLQHHISQPTMTTCSATSARMLINGLLHANGRPPCSHEDILGTDGSGAWSACTATLESRGVSLVEFARLLTNALQVVDFSSVKVVRDHMRDMEEGTVERLRRRLRQMEENSAHWIVANFLQSAFLQDGFDVGHMSLVGGYDETRNHVAIFDVDIRGLKPYWVTFEQFLKGLHTYDADAGDYRGVLAVWE
jgi:hypothetical protein